MPEGVARHRPEQGGMGELGTACDLQVHKAPPLRPAAAQKFHDRQHSLIAIISSVSYCCPGCRAHCLYGAGTQLPLCAGQTPHISTPGLVIAVHLCGRSIRPPKRTMRARRRRTSGSAKWRKASHCRPGSHHGHIATHVVRGIVIWCAQAALAPLSSQPPSSGVSPSATSGCRRPALSASAAPCPVRIFCGAKRDARASRNCVGERTPSSVVAAW